jgi:hypothetical protein
LELKSFYSKNIYSINQCYDYHYLNEYCVCSKIIDSKTGNVEVIPDRIVVTDFCLRFLISIILNYILLVIINYIIIL